VTVSESKVVLIAKCAAFLSHRHYLLFSAVPAVRPRALMTIDEDGKPLAVKVRVGQIVDTVGQAGKYVCNALRRQLCGVCTMILMWICICFA